MRHYLLLTFTDSGLEEYSRLLEQKKTEVVELNQRHIRDIEYYQQEIEKVTLNKVKGITSIS